MFSPPLTGWAFFWLVSYCAHASAALEHVEAQVPAAPGARVDLLRSQAKKTQKI